MRSAAFGIVALLALAASPAFACACRTPPKTDAAQTDGKPADAKPSDAKPVEDEHAGKFKLTAIRLRTRPNADPQAEVTAQVLEQPKVGPKLPQRLLLVTLGGDEDANCGRATQLFSAVAMQRWVRMQIQRSPDGRYEIGDCVQMDVEPAPAVPAKTN